MDMRVIPWVLMDDQGKALWALKTGMAGLAPLGRYVIAMPTEVDGEILDDVTALAAEYGCKVSVVGDLGEWHTVQVEGYGVGLVRWLVGTQNGDDDTLLAEMVRWAEPV